MRLKREAAMYGDRKTVDRGDPKTRRRIGLAGELRVFLKRIHKLRLFVRHYGFCDEPDRWIQKIAGAVQSHRLLWHAASTVVASVTKIVREAGRFLACAASSDTAHDAPLIEQACFSKRVFRSGNRVPPPDLPVKSAYLVRIVLVALAKLSPTSSCTCSAMTAFTAVSTRSSMSAASPVALGERRAARSGSDIEQSAQTPWQRGTGCCLLIG